jgi:hypothetical protein
MFCGRRCIRLDEGVRPEKRVTYVYRYRMGRVEIGASG